MSYEPVPIAQFCSFNGLRHHEEISFCSNCGLGVAEVIDLSGTPPRTNAGQSNQPPATSQSVQPLPSVAATQ